MHLMARLCLPELKSGGGDVPDWQMVNIILVWNHPEDGLFTALYRGPLGERACSVSDPTVGVYCTPH